MKNFVNKIWRIFGIKTKIFLKNHTVKRNFFVEMKKPVGTS